MKKFLMGNDILVIAAIDAGAKIMYGYPITPTTEVLANFINYAEKDSSLKYLQTEDEGAAGFGVCGSILAGVPAFTATAGPGNILMQDPIVMAEAMRLPFVGFIGQRGAPSTGTVIYSQQEVNLTIFGGNGEGFRIVYSTSSLQDLYTYGKKAFKSAWQYRYPTFVLYDGYQGKMKGEVDLPETNEVNYIPAEPILKSNQRNIYNLEEELGQVINDYQADFEKISQEVVEYELTGNSDAEVVILAHGIVAEAAKIAVLKLQKQGVKISLFRPITLWPFPKKELTNSISKATKLISFESALSQFARLVKSQIYPVNIPFVEVNKPAIGFTPEEIENKILELIK